MESTINWRLKASLFFYILFVLITIPYSFVYLLQPEFMPHHAAAAGQNWTEVDPAFQSLILGLMKAAGGAWLSIGIATTILIIKIFKQGTLWAYWAIPAIGLPSALVNSYIGINMTLNTPASPLWEIPVLAVLLLLFGFVLYMIPAAKLEP